MESSVILESSTTCWLSQHGWKGVCRIALTGTEIQHGMLSSHGLFMGIFRDLTQIHKHTSDTSLCLVCWCELVLWAPWWNFSHLFIDYSGWQCPSYLPIKREFKCMCVVELCLNGMCWSQCESMHGHGGVTPWHGWVCFLGKAFTEPTVFI